MTRAACLSDERLDRVLISERRIRQRVRQLAVEVSRDFAGHQALCLVGILKGGVVFMSDLGREIRRAGGPDLRYEFVRARAYAAGIKADGETSRDVRLELLPDDLAGKDVLLVEDILDQGFTLVRIRDALLRQAQAKSVRLCVLLDKALAAPTPQVQELRRQLHLDYVGFRVPDRWVAGYGLDAGEDFRELPFIAIVREEFYR